MKRNMFLISCLILITACSNRTIEKEETKLQEHKNVIFENAPIFNVIEDSKGGNKDISINIDGQSIIDNLKNICVDSRSYGSHGETTASNYLKSKLIGYGYIPIDQDFKVYKQTFNSTIHIKNYKEYFNINPYNSEGLGTGRNIIAIRDNHDNTKKTFYLSAHYDTTTGTTGVIDNGTGVSVLLEVAHQLYEYDSPFNIVIVFFSGEEYFRSGSRHFVSDLLNEDIRNIIGCINVDMVGEMGAGDIILGNYTGEYNMLSIMINDILDYQLEVLEGGYSDELSFYFGKIPAITLTNKSSNPSLDKVTNQFEYINLEELEEVAHLITNFIIEFNMDAYHVFLEGNSHFDSNKTFDKLGTINGFYLHRILFRLLENGYDGITEYLYKNEDGRVYAITERVNKFIPESLFTNYDVLVSDDNWKWRYFIHKDTNNNTNISYLTNSYFGEIKGEISVSEALNILYVYYKEEYKRIHGKYPEDKR